MALQTHMSKQVYVLRLDRSDGTSEFLTHLPFDPSRREALRDAMACFEDRFKSVGTVTVDLARSLADAGVGRPEAVPSWSEYQAQQNAALLQRLERAGVSNDVRGLIAESLNVTRNRASLLDEITASSFDNESKEAIRTALAVASEAHRGATAARPQDLEGLHHIPYVNHPISMARIGIRLGLSATAIQALLLHDVVEDTPTTSAELRKSFAPEVMAMVDAMTKQEGETRKQFLDRVGSFEGETKICKALDRFDNLIRGFAIPDEKYHARILAENAAIYLPAFASNPTLKPIAPMFYTLDRELALLAGLTDKSN